MEIRLRVLIVEDSPTDARLLLRELQRAGYVVEHARVDNASDMSAALQSEAWDVILSDFSMPNFSATAALKLMQEHEIDLPFIIVSGTMGEETAVAAMKAGAHDYFPKGRIARLPAAIAREVRDAQERQQRKQAEAELRRAEERFTKAFQASPSGITINTSEGIFVAANDAFRQVIGPVSGEIVGRTALELSIWHDPADRRLLQPSLEAYEIIRDAEVMLYTGTGEIRHVSVSTEYIELGGEQCVLAMWQDITQRKLAEATLQKHRQLTELLREITTAANEAVEVAPILDFVVARICGFAGWEWGHVYVQNRDDPQQALVSLSWYADAPGKFPAFADANYRHELTRAAGGLAYRVFTSGTSEWLVDIRYAAASILAQAGIRLVYAFPIFAQREVTAVIEFFATTPLAPDPSLLETMPHIATQVGHVIERVRAREEINQHAAALEQRVVERTQDLQAAKEYVETVLYNSSDAIILVRNDGTIQQTNPRFSELFGYNPDELFGRNLTEIISTEDAETVLQTLGSFTGHGQYRRVEVVARRKDRTSFPVDTAFAAFFHKHELDIVCSLRDISAQKHLEQELRAAFEQQKALTELKTQFISTVSHEYRTPLAIIHISANLLLRYSDRMTEEQQQGYLEKIQSQVVRLTELLNDILEIGREETIGLEFNPEPVNIVGLCREIITDMQQIYPGHPIQFHAAGEAPVIMADAKLLRQIVTNLLSNAVKYSPNQGVVRVALAFMPTQLTLAVADEGIGIPEEALGDLFTAFHRAKNVGHIQGTGLGLAIVKKAVEAHNGTISVESVVGRGTTFTVILPL